MILAIAITVVSLVKMTFALMNPILSFRITRIHQNPCSIRKSTPEDIPQIRIDKGKADEYRYFLGYYLVDLDLLLAHGTVVVFIDSTNSTNRISSTSTRSRQLP